MPELDEYTMERVLEEFEQRCYDNMNHAIETEEGLGIEYDEDVVCDVCQSPDGEDGNEMVFCDKCNICVHQVGGRWVGGADIRQGRGATCPQLITAPPGRSLQMLFSHSPSASCSACRMSCCLSTKCLRSSCRTEKQILQRVDPTNWVA
jgi:hypothetical protein